MGSISYFHSANRKEFAMNKVSSYIEKDNDKIQALLRDALTSASYHDYLESLSPQNLDREFRRYSKLWGKALAEASSALQETLVVLYSYFLQWYFQLKIEKELELAVQKSLRI